MRVRRLQTVSVWERTCNCDNNHEMTAMIFFPVSQKSSRKQYVSWFKLTTESINFIKCFHFLQKIRGKISCTAGTVISSRVDDLSFACTLAGDYVSRVAPVTNNWMANKNLIKINQTKKRQSRFTTMSLSLHSHPAPTTIYSGNSLT